MHGIARLPRPAHARDGRARRRFPPARVRRRRPALPARGAARPDLEVHGRARRRRAARQARRWRLAARQGVGARRAPRRWPRSCCGSTRQRSVVERSAFSGDSAWQGEFEAAFRFEETRDQMRAIEDVKADMAGPRPMDRLVAGDVGYGKTEVALRAAFKAVADGRQVAVLVPTTVLAQQHFNTFSERFGPFPAKVELLSRFRSPKEQKAVVEGLARGSVDVVIGTHRLLSKDVAFKNLGLLVIDEEHRFGVSHKERIKRLAHRGGRPDAHGHADPAYAQHGAVRRARPVADRDAAPRPAARGDGRDRRSAAVSSRTRSIARSARGGQVFFVHNRIQSLASMTTLHPGPVPRRAGGHGPWPDGGARARGGHGQVRGRPDRRSRLDGDRGVGPRHPRLQHHHHQSRRPLRPRPALPAPRARRTGAPAGLRLPPDPRRRPARRDGAAAALRSSRR